MLCYNVLVKERKNVKMNYYGNINETMQLTYYDINEQVVGKFIDYVLVYFNMVYNKYPSSLSNINYSAEKKQLELTFEIIKTDNFFNAKIINDFTDRVVRDIINKQKIF